MKKLFIAFTGLILINLTITISAQSGPDTIQVSAGWNLIGSLNTGLIPSIISTEPPGIITGSIYGYNPGSGYQPADTLKRGKGYWVKVSQNGIIIFRSGLNCGTVSYGGKIYNTVIIGTQCWLRENLDVGTMIPGSQNQSDNSVIEKYCYNDDPNNCTVYGGLYQWNESMQYTITPSSQGICPPGWHIPEISAFQNLATIVYNDGNSLKEVGQGTGGGAGTNTSGFSALLAGWRTNYNVFDGIGMIAYFWSSTEYNGPEATHMSLQYNNNTITLSYFFKNLGFSIRCVKD